MYKRKNINVIPKRDLFFLIFLILFVSKTSDSDSELELESFDLSDICNDENLNNKIKNKNLKVK